MDEAQQALPRSLHAHERLMAQHGGTLLSRHLRTPPSPWSFRSVDELADAVTDYVAHHNKDPKPLIWTATASDILEKVKCARKKLNTLQPL